jgi:MFS family permease
LELSFWNGEFPQLLTKDVIGLVLMCVGIAEVIGGLCLGKISDCLGRTTVILFGAVCYGGAMYLSVLLKRNDSMTQPYIWSASWAAYTAALLFGFADSAFNTCVYSHLGSLFADEGVAAFTWYDLIMIHCALFHSFISIRLCYQYSLNLLQNLGSAFGFYYSLVWPLHGDSGTYIQIWVQAGVLVIAVIGFIASDYYHRHQPSVQHQLHQQQQQQQQAWTH